MSVVLLAFALASSSPIYGIARAGDGDSLTVGATRIRLFGIDAPEFDQTCQRGGQGWACGKEAADKLASLVTGREVRCDVVREDQYGRTLAKCFIGAQEINRTMVSLGYAVAFRRYSLDYASAEESAKLNKRGIWSSQFQMPSDVRAAARHGASSAPPRARQPSAVASNKRIGCVIKGNHSRRGEWIYHLPGMPYYEQTRPEAIFCSEAEAQAAGYRRAIVR